MAAIRIALVGMGKIARDQHVPTLTASDDFALVAAASPNRRLEGVPNFSSLDALLDGVAGLDAVALCTPPQLRYGLARTALERGLHVFLEKPPGATLSEVTGLAELARQRNLALYASWHSRCAAGVAPARQWLREHAPRSVTVTWKEDVREWHPGQAWIWKAGGLGVFDPAINALSILTEILPPPLVLRGGELAFPSNCETPIAGTLEMTSGKDVPVRLEMDFLQQGPPSWDIAVETDGERLLLSRGGAVLRVGDTPPVAAPDEEYPRLYAAFAQLVRERRVDADATPLLLVADALMSCRRRTVEPFIE